MYRVIIGCETEGYSCHRQTCRAALELELGAIERDHVHACTRLLIEDSAFTDGRIYYGIDILHFADSLVRLHNSLEGSARLHDWDGETVLCLTVLKRFMGRIAIGGQLIPAVFWTQAMSEDRFLDPPLCGGNGGMRITFEGLVTDQSYLPPAIAQLRRFLAETKISVRSPME